MKRQYFSMERNGNEANINIYGDISSYPYEGSAPTAESLVATLDGLEDVSKINVYINSYGGEVAEGLAIYNALKRHKAKVVTYCDGFAASIASVIFMAGDERIMNDSSLLMIHNAWSIGVGNAEQLRKQADDLEKITQASVAAYKAHSTLSEEEIKNLMDKESWILPDEALEYGFATSIEKTGNKAASQNAKMQLLDIVKKHRQEADKQEADEGEEKKPDTDEEEPADDGAPADDEEKPADDEEDTDKKDSPEDTDGEEEEKTSQKINMFFNALLNL
jgi:ATP-dependent Clp protease protease subunit